MLLRDEGDVSACVEARAGMLRLGNSLALTARGKEGWELGGGRDTDNEG